MKKLKAKAPILNSPDTIPTPCRVSPAAVLIKDELDHRGLKYGQAADAMAIPRSRLSDMFAGRKGVSADTALRLQAYLKIPAAYLLRLQSSHDLSVAYHAKNPKILQQVQPA